MPVQVHACVRTNRVIHTRTRTRTRTRAHTHIGHAQYPCGAICAYEHGSEQARARGRDKVDLFALIHFLVKNTNEAAFFVDFGADGRLPNHSVITREISDQLDGELMHLYSHAYLHLRRMYAILHGRAGASTCISMHATACR